jgi:hypothetical protein
VHVLGAGFDDRIDFLESSERNVAIVIGCGFNSLSIAPNLLALMLGLGAFRILPTDDVQLRRFQVRVALDRA